MYTVKTVKNYDETYEHNIIETRSLPVNTVCKFINTEKEAIEELNNRLEYESIGMVDYYLKNNEYDF